MDASLPRAEVPSPGARPPARDPHSPAPSLDLAVALGLMLAVEVAARAVFGMSALRGAAAGPAWLRECGPYAATGAVRLVQAALAVLYLLAVRRRALDSLALSRAGMARSAVWGLGAAAVGAAGLAAWALARLAIPTLPGLSGLLGAQGQGGWHPAALASMLTAGVLAGPFAEEIAFRGILQRVLRVHAGPVPAIAASALVFAAAHWEGPCPLLWYVAGGLVFSLLLEKTGSLWAPIAAHAGGNAVLIGAGLLEL